MIWRYMAAHEEKAMAISQNWCTCLCVLECLCTLRKMGSLKIQIAKTIKTQAPIKIGLAAWGRWGRVSGNLGDFLEREIARKLVASWYCLPAEPMAREEGLAVIKCHRDHEGR